MNKKLFATGSVAATDAVNEAGGVAYSRSAREELAQLSVTGCLADTFYVSDESQLDKALALAAKCEPSFVAKCAVYASERAKMKDMPVLLTAWLVCNGHDEALSVFPRVVRSTKALAAFVRVMRSGKLGRKSLGRRPRGLVRRWIEAQTPENLWSYSIGVADPSLADILRLTHPVPSDETRRALYGYLSGRNPEGKGYDAAMLPSVVRDYEALKRGEMTLAQVEGHIPFQALTSMELTKDGWKRIALRASWQQARQLLNTFGRKGLWDDKEVVEHLASKLRDQNEIARAHVMPYQLLSTYEHVTDCPRKVIDALHDAVEHAVANCPVLPEHTYVFVDVSGSMKSPVTGSRGTATSKVRCVDAAALIATVIARRQPNAQVIAFDTRLHDAKLEPRDTIFTNAKKLAAFGGGNTNCSLPMLSLEARKDAPVDLVLYLSDNQSWCDFATERGTATAQAWRGIKKRAPKAKLALLDLTPSATTQARTGGDIINIGGFSDDVFALLAEFASDWKADAWTRRIEAIAL